MDRLRSGLGSRGAVVVFGSVDLALRGGRKDWSIGIAKTRRSPVRRRSADPLGTDGGEEEAGSASISCKVTPVLHGKIAGVSVRLALSRPFRRQ
jgi:hypothetical protein